MAHTHTAKYSWFNKTHNKAYYWEDKVLLNKQRMEGDICINVESERLLSKKQMSTIPQSLIKRVNKL